MNTQTEIFFMAVDNCAAITNVLFKTREANYVTMVTIFPLILPLLQMLLYCRKHIFAL